MIGLNYRKMARDKPCMVRLPGCDGGGPTTVLAHYRLSGYCGVGMKPDDFIFGAWSCFSCHELIDRRACIPNLTKDDVRLAHLEAILRTQAAIKDAIYG